LFVVAAGGTDTDRLAIESSGQVAVTGNQVSVGGTVMGSFTGGGDGNTPLVVTLNTSATPAAMEERVTPK